MKIHQAVAFLSLCGVSMVLGGCGSTQKSNTTTESIVAPVPTYKAKASVVSLEKLGGGICNSEVPWTGSDWHKAIPTANACVKARDWNRLEKLGNDLAIRAPLTPWGPYYLSLAAEGRRDYPRARWMLELAIKKAPNEGLFHYELGRIFWDLKESADALRELKLASEASPGLTEAHWIMGRIALQRQEYSQADAYLQKAIESNPRHMPSLMTLAALKINRKDFKQAEELLNRATSVNPRSTKARLALAQVQEEHQKKLSEALHTYRQIKQLAADRKLDEGVTLNLDDKIKTLEKSISQVNKGSQQLTVRTPSAERNVQP